MTRYRAAIIAGIFVAAFASGVGLAYLKGGVPVKLQGLSFQARAAAIEQPIGFSRDGWEITATHQHPDHPPELALDGDPNTVWTSGEGMAPGMSLTVNLGKPRPVSRIVLRLPTDKKGDRPRGLAVETSPDGKQWERVDDATVNISEATGEASVDFPPRLAQALRLSQTGTREQALASCGHGAYWWSAGEVYVQGP